ncbi:Uu.00g077480.m01.CDS01 [Anthostomella pinea]|uniref:Uu.00g077480.m01.CDS01 n=1 Tax=Anthostomella pinea TaxID=933095 RepID=A0AAI8YPA8_9PEZI|nr:Uu.00g077480.m01.CDS01 [Anthostomella pinea]
MRPRQVLSSLMVPATAFSLPTSTSTSPTSSPVDLDTRATAATSDDASPTCDIVDFPTTPTNPPKCWAWFAKTTPSDYCGDSTFTPVDIAAPANWLAACVSLRETLLDGTGDFFLADYETDQFNTLLSQDGCALQLKPQTAPSDEQIYVGGTDVTDILGSAIAASRAGKVGVEGTMPCGDDTVQWRMVPV